MKSRSYLSSRVYDSVLLTPDLCLERDYAIEKLRVVTPDIIVLTATKNRLQDIKNAHLLMSSQQGSYTWMWLIVDNGSTDGTIQFVATLGDERVIYVRYLDRTGYAAPVRNFGLDLIHYALGPLPVYDKYVCVVDSDDRLFDEYSLYELATLARKKPDAVMYHGYAHCAYHSRTGIVTYATVPRSIDACPFPLVPNLTEELAAGPGIVSGMLPLEYLSYLRYPDDFSFEDDTMNQKVLLQAIKRGDRWEAIEYPIVEKKFHDASMGGRFNELFGESMRAKIGEWEVTGIRALIVRRLHQLRDFFFRDCL